MITTKSRPAWPGDIDLQDYPVAGLKTACIVRLKMFTLDNRLIVRQIGALSESDRAKTAQQIRSCLALQS